MKTITVISLTVITLLLSVTSSKLQTKPVYTMFKNGNIYTANDRQPQAETIVVDRDRIVFVGSNQEAEKYVQEKQATSHTIDLQGKTLLPGFTDAHCHLLGIGQRELILNLEGTTNLEDFLAKVKARVDKAKPGEWVIGRGWIETFWKPALFPTRSDLDKVSPNNPLFLQRADGHGAVVNSMALKIAGINKDTANPFGGEILKDKTSGEPNGMLLDNAHSLVVKNIPPTTAAEFEQAALVGSQRSVELGWCQVQDAGGTENDVELFQRLYATGKLKLRIYKAVHGPSTSATKLLQTGATIGKYDQRFTLRTIKVVMDGALGSRGAALLEPYADYETTGFLTNKEEELMPLFTAALRQGIQIETHAIGDRANRVILDLYEKAFNAVPVEERKVREPRWRIEHAQIVEPIAIPRFAKLGIIPSMQPSHAISDLHFAPSRLGIKRLEGAYAWQTFLKSGSIIAGGSHAPVERGDPLIEFYAAVARKDIKGFSGEGWHPEQVLTREQALKMFTFWAAYAAFEEESKGSIEVGKLADFTIFSADIMKIPAAEILQARCVGTVIGGEFVFQAIDKRTNIELAEEIAKLYQTDQAIQFDFQLNPLDEKHNDRIETLFASNIKRLKQIIKAYGWPGKSLVGKETSQKFFILVDHSDADIEFQKKCLLLIERAVEQEEATKAQMAYLTDRILVKEHKKQIYGTQMMDRNENSLKEITPHPIEDEANVDKRREAVGLEPLAKYIEGLKALEKELQEKLSKSK